MKSNPPWFNAAVQMEVVSPELPQLSGIAGLHFVTRQGARLFPCLDRDGKVEKYVAFLVSGEENALPPDVRTDGEPFTFGATRGLAITFPPDAIAVVEPINKQITEAIEKLKQYICEVPHA